MCDGHAGRPPLSISFLQTIVGRSAGLLDRFAHPIGPAIPAPDRGRTLRACGGSGIARSDRSSLVLSGAFLLEMLAPWQRICAVTSGDEPRICGWRTGYEGRTSASTPRSSPPRSSCGLLPILIPRLSMRGWPTAVVTACLSVALAVTLVKLIHDNEFQTIWAWIGLALALGVMLTALIGSASAGRRDTGRGPRQSDVVPPPQGGAAGS